MKYETPICEVEVMGDELGASFGGPIPMPEEPLAANIL